MPITVKETYRTSDGKEFNIRMEAEKHELEIARMMQSAELAWLDRHCYDLDARVNECRWRLADLLDKLEVTAYMTGDATADLLAVRHGDGIDMEKVRGLQEAMEERSNLLCAITTVGEEADKWLRAQRAFNANLYQLAEDNKDMDGTCQYSPWLPDGMKCGQPTVEGTRWCTEHLDQWCDQHGKHVVGFAPRRGVMCDDCRE